MRTILVTGGNRGIGLAVVKALAAAEADQILIGCRDVAAGQQLADELGSNVKAVRVDLANADAIANSIETLRQAAHKIDVLINNAGYLAEGSLLEVSSENLAQSFFVNAIGPAELAKALLSGMIKNGYGRVVNVSSGWGSFDDGLGGPFSYSVSKAALNAATLAAANSVSHGDIKINAVCPGWVRTRMGGQMATRSPDKGAETIVWLANLPKDGPTGGFFRDQKLIEW